MISTILAWAGTALVLAMVLGAIVCIVIGVTWIVCAIVKMINRM